MWSTIIYLLYLIPVMYLGVRAYKRAVNIENFLVSNWSIPLWMLVGTLSASLATASYFLASVSMGIQEGAFEGITTKYQRTVFILQRQWY